MSDAPRSNLETARFLAFLVSLYERVAAGEDVPPEWLDRLANLDPVLINLLADAVAAVNAKAIAAHDQPQSNVVSFPRPGHEREPVTTPSFAR